MKCQHEWTKEIQVGRYYKATQSYIAQRICKCCGLVDFVLARKD